MCKYFIIDKENSTFKVIKNVMVDFDIFKCIGVSSDADDAMNTILKEHPKVVFINLDSTVKNLFQFMYEISLYSTSAIEFIAISSQKSNAYDAIKMGFCDFLLAPLTDLEIRKTVLNFQKKKLTKSKKCICLKSYKDYHYLNTDEILFLKADNNTTEFHMSDGSVVNAYKTLKTFESLLPKEFSRIHKSYIINKNFVSRIQFGKFTCSINRNNHSIPFTNTYLSTIKRMNDTLSQFTSNQSILN